MPQELSLDCISKTLLSLYDHLSTIGLAVTPSVVYKVLAHKNDRENLFIVNRIVIRC